MHREKLDGFSAPSLTFQPDTFTLEVLLTAQTKLLLFLLF